MANLNEYIYLKKFIDEYPLSTWPKHLDEGRILNIGSADHGQNGRYRELFAGREMIGIDIVRDNGVDMVCDITGDCKELNGEHFAVILCTSVLEHCKYPWIAAANIERLLLPQGLLYIAQPWVWRTHSYPEDYWRMTPEAIKILFPHVLWKRIGHASQAKNEFIEGDHDQNEPWRIIHRGRGYLCAQSIHMIGRMA